MKSFLGEIINTLLQGDKMNNCVRNECGMPPSQLVGPAQKFQIDHWYEMPQVEKVRRYFFQTEGDPQVIRVENVKAFMVSSSGNHRLITTDGELVIIRGNWVALVCEPPICY